MRPNFTDYSYTTLIENENDVRVMDVDPVDRILYYVNNNDDETQHVKRTFIPVSSRALGYSQRLLIETEKAASPLITALAIDWLAKNLYYVQGDVIRVAKSDGRYAKTLITQNVSIDVTSIVVNPLIGYLKFIFF